MLAFEERIYQEEETFKDTNVALHLIPLSLESSYSYRTSLKG
jgi:hypothetical protein